jgi:uncharacterized delta-60 repeat protein
MRNALLFAFFAAVASGARADGTLDPSFGNGGTVVAELFNREQVSGLVVTPSGDVVAVGNRFFTPPNFTGRMVMLWVLSSGAPKPSFGTNGFLVVAFPGDPNARGNAIAVQADGKVVVAGHAGGLAALVRFDADGALDPSFGTGGRVLWACPGGGCGVYGLAVQPDGRIVALMTDSGEIVVRFLPDGTIDPSFGTAGVATLPPSWGLLPTAIAVREGRIFVAGVVGSLPATDFAAARLLGDGTLDTAFGGDGLAAFPLTDTQFLPAGSLVAQERGAVVLAGGSYSETLPSSRVAVRLLADGTPDARFGRGGVAMGGSGGAGSIVELPDGKLLQTGSGFVQGQQDLQLVRYLPDGALDPTFGAAGILGIGLDDRQLGRALAYAGPERVVIGGVNEVLGGLSGEDLLLARVIALTPVSLQSFVVE